MDELRFVRREDLALIVSNDTGEEFRLVVDDAVLSELRHLSRRERDAARVRPREIQALIRAGRTRAEVAAQTGLDEADIERYEEPVLAERRYILERAHAVPVRTGDLRDDEDQRFGAVIAERLVSLEAEATEWSSWKDEETGWMVSLEFISHDAAHRAVWGFDHRKSTLAPITPDAVSLSKQGEVGDRLIPKLHAVENRDRSGRFDSDAFDADELPIAVDDEPESEPPAPSLADADAEYERRREIDQRAIKTGERAPEDLSQTADLLDALRRRRGEREQQARAAQDPPEAEAPSPEPDAVSPEDRPANGATRSIWSAAGVTGGAETAGDERPTPGEEPEGEKPGARPENDRARKGRASIPSWDDILFGTRSDEDPA